MQYSPAFLAAVVLAACVSETSASAESIGAPCWLPATPEQLPRWRGFNLLEKFVLGGGRKPFVEDDFRLISKLGFNFVRLPMDYRFWIQDGDWEQFDEATLREIDQAVQWGEQYGIHVCINFHRAPGYTVARPPEKTSLWTDAQTQRVCAKHWAMFARRYRGIPSTRVSFNLMNEPAGIEPEVYLAVVRKLVDAIRAEDPDRLIISDGMQWGQIPLLELRELRVAQATRGYTPAEISHYKASWVNSSHFPEPQWPRPLPPNGTLLSPRKKEGSHPLVIEGPFPAATELRLRVLTVSASALLVVEADGKRVLEKKFQCGPGEGEWKKAEFKPEYNIYQNLFDRDYSAMIPALTRQISVRVADGDWLQIGQIGLKPGGADAREAVLTLKQDWGQKPEPIRYAPGAPDGPFVGIAMQDKTWLWSKCIQPWKEAQEKGIGVMVGEWGAYNKTPHDVFLRWAEDSLSNWQQAGWGWALWNFRGSFGVLDSERQDVAYEEFEGHQLDRKLLDLLQRY
ncbi:MAG: glycoside hydrolase family 5 protein [Candidatus Anammoximicrobium sp.]|nr:glycoside hydrolase family 5 protein [Candidatus Anammoximicrobium sp.]